MITEQEKFCTEKLAQLEESLKKKKRVNTSLTFTLLFLFDLVIRLNREFSWCRVTKLSAY